MILSYLEILQNQKSAQKIKKLKDVYFLDEDSNFHNSKYFEKFKLDFYPWLLNYQERSSLNGENDDKNCHKTISISDEFGAQFWSRFKTIVLQLNLILKIETNLEGKAKILTLLRKGYDLLSRITSFYHPDVKFEIRDYLRELKVFNELIESSSLKDKIIGLEEVIESNLLLNEKIKSISSIIKNKARSKSVIVSKNNNSEDKKEAQRIIFDETNQKIEFIGLDELKPSTLKNYDNAFFLHFSGKYTRTLFLLKFCENQFIILNNKSETGYYRKCFQNFVPEIIELSDFDNKLILLNLEEQEELIERN